jgi:DNA-binding CsgD family transcriptional regulator
MIGIEPEEVTPYHFMESAHPDDIQRLNRGRSKIINLAQNLFIAEKGYKLMSVNYRFRNPSGGFSNILVQGYLFFTRVPYKTVFFFKLHTNIDWYKKTANCIHYYIGNELSYFRYPDEELLNKGQVFTRREFEIIRLIEAGLSSEQIAEKLFLSLFTINTHRANILEKTGKAHISDLIYELKESGLL